MTHAPPYIVIGYGNVLFGFAIAAALAALLVPLLKRMQFRQTAYEDAPKTHQAKTGTPTMGGIVFVVGLAPLAFFGPPSIWLFALVAACAAIGFFDDYVAIRKGRNAGLRASTKFLLTALMAVIFLRLVAPYGGGVLFRAGTLVVIAPYWLWLLLGVLAVSGTIHAVNLADGLDGLATGTMVPPLLAFGLLTSPAMPVAAVFDEIRGIFAAQAGAFLGIGACFGFLLFNRHPARLFMGDTGSLALGALLSGVAILSGEMLLLIVVGGVFVAEALSVILQVVYFKLTHGKRIFKMSPLHHHFELSGWPETKVTQRFWLASIVCSGVGLAIVR
jgi:phospho-N-acetylmuramoyl-pentapeptide-transferase